jgi:hypothetical protein
MATILNLAIVQFLMKKEGDVRYKGASPISIKGRCMLREHVSFLPNSITKIVNRIFSTGYSLH